MERLQIVKISPTENMTVLVETPVPGARHAEIVEKLMAYGGVNCEQVGYIEPPRDPAARARLQMMGGEFCGNATMSLASFLCFCDAMPAGAQADIPLEVSGMEGTLACHVCCLAEGEYEGTVQMPRPLSISRQTLAFSNTAYSVICVRMDGIAHLLIDAKQVGGAGTSGSCQGARGAEPTAVFLDLLHAWAPLFAEEAVGLVLCDFERDEIRPLVYVKPTGSAVWERGCGSGSAAYGAAMAWKTGREVEIPVRQPGGTITVRAGEKGVSIRGKVKIVMRGEAYV